MKRGTDQFLVFLVAFLLFVVIVGGVVKFAWKDREVQKAPSPVLIEGVVDDSSLCGVAPITQSIENRVGSKIVEMFNLQEEYNRYFIVFDINDKWSVYDIGNDGIIDTIDDAVYPGDKIDKSSSGNVTNTSHSFVPPELITSVDINFNEKLFWLKRDSVAKTVSVKSCTLNTGCKDVKIEITLLENNFKLNSVSPILAINKGQNPVLYFTYIELPSYTNKIAKCNLYGNDAKSCKNINSFSKLNQLNIQVNSQFYPLKDTGFISSRDIFYYNTEKIVSLWQYYDFSRLISAGVITGIERTVNPVKMNLITLDLSTGNKLYTIDSVMGDYLATFKSMEPIILDMKLNRLIVLYGEPWVVKSDLYAKVLGSPNGKVILNDWVPYDRIEDIIYLAGGQFIAEGKSDAYSEETPEDIVLLTCSL